MALPDGYVTGTDFNYTRDGLRGVRLVKTNVH